MRLFYATTAPADFIGAHQAWEAGVDYGNEVSKTFSGQIESFVSQSQGRAMMISGHPDGRRLAHDWFDIRHMPPRPSHGWKWHVERFSHARTLLNLAKEFSADVAVIDSGTMPYFFLPAFRRAGMKVIPVFHNTLYPLQRPSISERVGRCVDSYVLRRTEPICVSPACRRQLGNGTEIRAQFSREYFTKIEPARFERPFNVLFVGRIDATKGVFDIVEAARICGAEVSWTICGTGPDLDKLRREAQGLPIDIRGWTSPDDQIALRSRCQAVIVPTRSNFAEGMAMSAVEAILSGRPLITSRTVPALEVLRPACVEAEPDDFRSYASAVLSLARDERRWKTLVSACAALEVPFYDQRHSLTAALGKIVGGNKCNYVEPPGSC